MKKRLPPFGREVERILKTPSELRQFSGCRGKRGSVWIATGPNAWTWRNDHPLHLCLVMPYGEDPFSFRWNFLKGHEPPLILPPIADDPEMRAPLAAAMLRDGVLSVLACGNDALRYSKG